MNELLVIMRTLRDVLTRLQAFDLDSDLAKPDVRRFRLQTYEEGRDVYNMVAQACLQQMSDQVHALKDRAHHKINEEA